MTFELFAYIASTVLVAIILIWGRLEWHAAILVGLMAPIVGIIVGTLLPIHAIILARLGVPNDWNERISNFIVQTWTILGAFLLARSLRSKGYRRSSETKNQM